MAECHGTAVTAECYRVWHMTHLSLQDGGVSRHGCYRGMLSCVAHDTSADHYKMAECHGTAVTAECYRVWHMTHLSLQDGGVSRHGCYRGMLSCVAHDTSIITRWRSVTARLLPRNVIVCGTWPLGTAWPRFQLIFFIRTGVARGGGGGGVGSGVAVLDLTTPLVLAQVKKDASVRLFAGIDSLFRPRKKLHIIRALCCTRYGYLRRFYKITTRNTDILSDDEFIYEPYNTNRQTLLDMLHKRQLTMKYSESGDLWSLYLVV
ncbi:hypothetical protein J6590_020343 [Homalodisca vitripennis]|nr:hypothetical protein J6590_020343 [Homalodisca vitripennis]